MQKRTKAEKRMVEIVNYVKVQCSTYTHYNESSESKSLLRAIESARQMSTNIDVELRNDGQLRQGISWKKICKRSGWIWHSCARCCGKACSVKYSSDESLTDEITDYLKKRYHHGFCVV